MNKILTAHQTRILSSLSIFLYLFILLLLASCTSNPALTLSPTTVVPTQTAPPPTETPAELPADTPAPTIAPQSIGISIENQTAVPLAIESQPSETAETIITFGDADLKILRPGQLSRITSPMRMIISLEKELSLKVKLSLFGEDGRTITEKNVYALPYSDPVNGNLTTDMDFNIPTLTETARLEISVLDSYGRIHALNSVDLILVSTGTTDRNYAQEKHSRILIQYPYLQDGIEGGTLLISGLAHTALEQPLTLWMTDQQGNQITEGTAAVIQTDNPNIKQFVAEISYQVESPTWVRLAIGLPGGRIPGFAYIQTFEILLNP